MPTSTGALTQQQLLQAVAPQTAGDQLTEAATTQQIGLIGPQVAQQVAYGNALAGLQTGQYNITQAQNALQQTENTQQLGQNTLQQGIEQTGYGLQQQAFGIQGSELGVSQNQLNLQYQNALQGQQNQGAASGTLYTHGQQQAIGTLGQNYNLSSQQLGLQGQLLGNQSAQAANTQAGEVAGYQFSQEQLGNAQQNLQLIAQANGLTQQQALTMLNFQNQQAGLQGQQQTLQLLSQLGSTESGDLGNVGSALSAQGFAGGINALAGTKG